MGCSGKHASTIVFYIVGLIFFAASAGTGFAMYDNTSSVTHTGYFQRCVTVGTSSITCVDVTEALVGGCAKTWEMIQAGRAFTILASIFSGVTAIAAIVRCCKAPLFLVLPTKIIFGALCIATIIFGIIDLAIGFALMNEELCGNAAGIKSATGYFGPSAPLAVIGTFFFIVSLIIECTVAEPSPLDAVEGGASSDSKKDENAPDAENNKKAEEKKTEDKKVEEKKDAAPAVVVVANTTKTEEKKEEEAPKKKEKPQINWKEINAKLPYDKTSKAQRERRFAMFDEIDVNKNKKVSLAEVDAGMKTILGLGDLIDVPLVVRTAFAKAAAAGQAPEATTSNGQGSADSLEKNEFRLFLMYTRMYFEMYHLFSDLDESGDMMVELSEFEKAIPLLKTWGAKIDDAAATFKQIDKSGGGKVSFAEFVDWALSPEQNLDCPDEDE